jgi:hypothetical protein
MFRSSTIQATCFGTASLGRKTNPLNGPPGNAGMNSNGLLSMLAMSVYP